jgi:glycosyltransferase involved in cell wall biosynthesis
MAEKITVYHTAPLRAESGNGVLEYVYQVSKQGRQDVNFKFIYFSEHVTESFVREEVEGFEVLAFPKPSWRGFCLPGSFKSWLRDDCEASAIFHIHSVFNPANFSLGRALFNSGKRYVFTPHDSYSPESMVKNKTFKLLYLKTFEKVLLDRASVVHALTPAGAEYIARYTSNPNRVTVTNFVPDAPCAEDVQVGEYASFVGRYDFHQKGIDLMLEVLGKIKSKPASVLPFKIVGKFSEAEGAALHQLMQQNGLASEDVVQAGRLSFEDKQSLLQQSRFYFQLSRFEGFGLAIAEALSLGVPVVISEQVPISSIIKQFKAGFVVRDVAGALDAVEAMYTMEAQDYRSMRLNARKCYERSFHPERVMPELIAVYQMASKVL